MAVPPPFPSKDQYIPAVQAARDAAAVPPEEDEESALILPKNANMKVLSHGTTMQLEANGLISVGLTRVFLSKRPKACGRPVMPNATI